MEEKSNREIAEGAFREWQDGTGYITDLLADDLRWTIVGRSRPSKTYTSKEAFVGEVLEPFGARFSEPFRPVAIRGVYATATPWSSTGTGRALGSTASPTRTRTRGSCGSGGPGGGGDRLLRQHRLQRAVGRGRPGGLAGRPELPRTPSKREVPRTALPRTWVHRAGRVV